MTRSMFVAGLVFGTAVCLGLGVGGRIAAGNGAGGSPSDTDGDGLEDEVETGTGVYVDPGNTGTDPLLSDTDGDGLSDGAEVLDLGTDPNLGDTDGDGLLDSVDKLPTLRIFARFELPEEVWMGEPCLVRIGIEDIAGRPVPGIGPVRFRLSSSSGLFSIEARTGAVLEGGGTGSILAEAQDGALEIDLSPESGGVVRFEIQDPEGFGLGSEGGGGEPVRINCGGEAYVDSSGATWSADSYFIGGEPYLYYHEVEETEDDPLYTTERFFYIPEDTGYSIPVSTGRYEVRLHFVEMCDWCSPRIFDVLLEGETAIEALDPAGDPGYFRPIVRSFDALIEDGSIDISFRAISENPKISAIEVLGGGAVRGRTEVLVIDGAADPDEDGLTNVGEAARGTDPLDPDSDDDGALDGADPYPLTWLGATLSPVPPHFIGVPSLLAIRLERLDGVPIDAADKILFTLAASEGTVFVGAGADGQIIEGLGTGEVLVESAGASAEVSLVSGYSQATIRVEDTRSAGIVTSVAYDSIFRVNCGGQEYVDRAGLTWETDDRYCFNGGYYSCEDSVDVAGTDDDPLFRTERYAMTSYTFPTGPGKFQVRLLFAEIWMEATSPGIRVFDVAIQGELVIDDLDLFAQVGWGTAYEEKFAVEVDGSDLWMDFLPVVQNPKISAIEVLGKALSQPIVTIEFSEEPLPAFIRGDATGNGRLTIGDPVMVLRHIFGPQDLTCEDAADADDDGKLDLADPILVLGFLFRGGVSIPPPAKTCAADLTTDEISCVSHYFCGEQ